MYLKPNGRGQSGHAHGAAPPGGATRPGSLGRPSGPVGRAHSVGPAARARVTSER
jgi:hypothetical protein